MRSSFSRGAQSVPPPLFLSLPLITKTTVPHSVTPFSGHDSDFPHTRVAVDFFPPRNGSINLMLPECLLFSSGMPSLFPLRGIRTLPLFFFSLPLLFSFSSGLTQGPDPLPLFALSLFPQQLLCCAFYLVMGERMQIFSLFFPFSLFPVSRSFTKQFSLIRFFFPACRSSARNTQSSSTFLLPPPPPFVFERGCSTDRPFSRCLFFFSLQDQNRPLLAHPNVPLSFFLAARHMKTTSFVPLFIREAKEFLGGFFLFRVICKHGEALS